MLLFFGLGIASWKKKWCYGLFDIFLAVSMELTIFSRTIARISITTSIRGAMVPLSVFVLVIFQETHVIIWISGWSFQIIVDVEIAVAQMSLVPPPPGPALKLSTWSQSRSLSWLLPAAEQPELPRSPWEQFHPKCLLTHLSSSPWGCRALGTEANFVLSQMTVGWMSQWMNPVLIEAFSSSICGRFYSQMTQLFP